MRNLVWLPKGWVLALGSLLLVGLLRLPASAQTIDDPLHGECNPGTSCLPDNGTVTPVLTNTPNYGFSSSSPGASGTLDVITLIPNNVAGGGSLVFTVNGNAASKVDTEWTSGDLDTFLGISASPANPIGAYLPTTDAFSPGATGYFVYEANLGTQTLQGPGVTPTTPTITDSISLPIGSSIVAFLNNSIATANSGQLSIQHGTSTVPEASSLMLFGFGVLALGFVIRRNLLPGED